MIFVRLATSEDNQQLLELTAATEMSGKTSLRIDRKPNFFALLNMRGQSTVFVAEHENRIVGSLSISLQQVFINKEVVPVYYIGDFKVAKSHRGKGVGKLLCDELIAHYSSSPADLFFLTVAKGNTRPLPFFSGRAHIPDFQSVGTFHVHQFPGRKQGALKAEKEIETVEANNEVITFLSDHYCKYQLGSVITREKLAGCSIYIIRSQSKICAAMCLIDTADVKQNVIMNLDWVTRLSIAVMNTVRKLIGFSRMPGLNEPVRMFYIKYIAVENNERSILGRLIRHAQQIAYNTSYSFVSMGVHEKDPLNACLAEFFKFTFQSTGLVVSVRDSHLLIDEIKKGVPFEDYSLV